MKFHSDLIRVKRFLLLFSFFVLSLVSRSQSVYQVTAERLNVRTTPSIQGKLLGQLNEGFKVNVIEIKNQWAAISFNGRTCYVSAKYLKKVENEKVDVADVKQNEEFREEDNHSDDVHNHAVEQQTIPPQNKKKVYSIPKNGSREVLWNLKGGIMQKTYLSSAKRWGTYQYENNSTDIFWSAGLEIEVPISDNLNIETGLHYRNTYWTYDSNDGDYTNTSRISLLEIPVRLAYKFPLAKNLMLHAGIGPYVANSMWEDTHVGLQPSAVLYWKNLNLGLNYNIPLYKTEHIDEKLVSSNNVVLVTLGIRFKSKVWKHIGTGALVVGAVAGSAALVYADMKTQGNATGVLGTLDGSSEEGTPNSSNKSSKKTKKAKSCTHCYGTGICNYCNGDGFNYVGGNPVKCEACRGLIGKCKWCKGLKKR